MVSEENERLGRKLRGWWEVEVSEDAIDFLRRDRGWHG
jgi:hypothetical protein